MSGWSKYESLELLTLQKHSPELSDRNFVRECVDRKLVAGVEVIIHSNLTRARETAEVIRELFSDSSISLKPTPLLNEVRFSIKALATEEEYQKHGSDIVRKRFIDHFIADKLLESREEIAKRIQGLLKLLNTQYQNKRVLCVSHSFFMKIFKIYLADSNLFEDPDILKDHFNPKKKTFEFCEGFCF